MCSRLLGTAVGIPRGGSLSYSGHSVHAQRRCLSIWPFSSGREETAKPEMENLTNALPEHLKPTGADGSLSRIDVHQSANTSAGFDEKMSIISNPRSAIPEEIYDPTMIDLLGDTFARDIGEMVIFASPPYWVMNYAIYINDHLTTSVFPTMFLIALSVQPLILPLVVLNMRDKTVSCALQKHVHVLWRYSVQKRANKNIEAAQRAKKAEVVRDAHFTGRLSPLASGIFQCL